MLPNLFLIGAAKSGTTSLHYYLDQHPEIAMSREKEPNYFSFGGKQSSGRPQHVIDDHRAYESLFESDCPVRGEASVTYAFHPYPSGVAQRIHEAVPGARFIYLVRDPIQRSLSHYRHRVVLGEEHRSLREVVTTPDDRRERYVAASCYASQLEQYLEHFSLERFLVLEHQDLLLDRNGVLRRCFEFLGVDRTFTSPDWERQLNATDGQRRYSRLADRLRHSGAYRRTIGWFDPSTRDRLLNPVRRLLTEEVVVEDHLTDDLRAIWGDRFRPEAERFRALTGLACEGWSV